ncbi:hypothetical protein QWZ06_23420 [Chryseobacterium tructae]|uniref:hypothetical protein n=1 Tax=Chryseobacterium tructae TaxID=1037380 RepID=UPI0025B53A47|nr:hypothetical protein [Chryseobacterium tructae]MDN3694973.1 hypothetical protein [Chryseobacterium tructae]
MSERNILNLGKAVFGVFFLIGNICLFGYILTKDFKFASLGFLIVSYGAAFNLIVLAGLMLYGLIDKNKTKTCFQSAGYLLIIIPFAILYIIIGWDLVF